MNQSTKFNRQRRLVMRGASALGLFGVLPMHLSEARPIGAPAAGSATDDPWKKAQVIIDRLTRPITFRDEDFVITAYGAVPCTLEKVKAWISFEEQAMLDAPVSGSPDCYHAIAAAIAACSKAGGGRVVIPAGDWYCAGPVVLLSNVNVHLRAGARLHFSNQPADYAKYGEYPCGENGNLVMSRWQSNDCLNFSSMIYARGQHHIALTGEDWTSVLNGQGGVPFDGGDDCWWTWKGKIHTIAAIAQSTSPAYIEGRPSEGGPNPRNPTSLAAVSPDLSEAQRHLLQGDNERWRSDFAYLPTLSEAGVPAEKRVFGLGHYLRPPMIQLIDCSDVLLQDYQVTHTPFWQHHPVHCRNLLIRHVHANSLGPNSDGFDPESCDGVLVNGCTFNTGDDCIAIKSGKDLDTQYGPSQNIVIQNCVMQSGHGAVTLGSEMAGGIENVYAQNLLFQNINWASNPLNTAIRLKTNMNRGGYLRNFYVRNITIPNGVQTSPSFYHSLPGSPIAPQTVASAAGAVITFDCDYQPMNDNVRTRPPSVSNIHISGVTVGNVKTKNGLHSCYQAIVIQGPVSSDYNGADRPPPAVPPVSDVFISDCDFGTPANTAHPWYLYNVKGLRLENVTIAAKVYKTSLTT
jgi:polygalacturonase